MIFNIQSRTAGHSKICEDIKEQPMSLPVQEFDNL